MSGRGKVYLIGAGPGDPGLISLKALNCLKKAEVVIYDYLANEIFLEHVPADAEIIYVGKRGGDHTMSQEEINRLLVEKGRDKVVVRLKGGDPFIYGRGGEEAEVLVEGGVTFEVVPGITSAIAVPAYAGIPLSHRDYASSIGFITGHERSDRAGTKIDWGKLATGVDTLVFLMGMKNLPHIVGNLMANGRGAETPIALIQWGTTNRQRTVTGTLSTIEEKAREAGISAPAIIVVGDVVSLRPRLNWFEKKPLFGKTVLVTRSREQASEFQKMLSELGAHCVVFPTIKIVPPKTWKPLDEAIQDLSHYDWLVYTSVNGVKFFFERLFIAGKDSRALNGMKLCAIGPKTADMLETFGLHPDFVPGEYRAEAIVEGLGKENLVGKKILLPRALVARDILPQELSRLGASVDVVPSYRTVLPETIDPEIKEDLLCGRVDCITFTASSTVRNFSKFISPDDLKSSGQRVTVACIGPVTADTARKAGFDVHIMPRQYTLKALVQAIVDFYSDTP